MTFDPSNFLLAIGASREIAVAIAGAAGTATLSLPGLAAGYSGEFSDNPISVPGSTTMTLSRT